MKIFKQLETKLIQWKDFEQIGSHGFSLDKRERVYEINLEIKKQEAFQNVKTKVFKRREMELIKYYDKHVDFSLSEN